MDVRFENCGKLERRLTARVPRHHIESQVQARLLELARTASIKNTNVPGLRL